MTALGLAVPAPSLGSTGAGHSGTGATFTPGEGTGPDWCPGYGGINLGSYKDVYACEPKAKRSGKTPFDSDGGFQCTELANRYLYAVTGKTLFENEEGGNFVALAAAAYSFGVGKSGSGALPAAGDIISMWGGRSGQRQDGSRTQVAVVTKVVSTSAGSTITTLNQGDPSDTDGQDGLDTITVSASGKTWSTLDGFYATFDWLKTAGQHGAGKTGGSGTGGSGTGTGGKHSGSGSGSAGLASWTAAEAPETSTAQSGQLLAVACSSAANCTAVGDNGGAALLDYRSGSAWKSVSVPVPSSAATQAELTAVTCPSATACVAVGQYRSSGRQQGVLLAGHRSSWTATRAPLPASAAAQPRVELASVACANAAACVAAGQYTASSGSTEGLLVVGHGSSWTAYQAALPADAGPRPEAKLTSVACPSASACVAVGDYTDKAGNEQGMLVTGSGAVWAGTRAALPASAVTPGASLASVSCPAVDSCVAAGSFSANQQGMMLTGWNTSWQASSTPLPAGAAVSPATSFHEIVCLSVTACIAVGSYTAGPGASAGLVLSGHGSAWTAIAAPLPAGAAANQGTPGARLASVACSAASACVAAGQYTDTAGDARLLLLSGHAALWTARQAPLPSNDRVVGSQAQGELGPPFLAAVTCPSAAACVAVGTYPARSLGMEGLLETSHP
jgi:hypothetical protein